MRGVEEQVIWQWGEEYQALKQAFPGSNEDKPDNILEWRGGSKCTIEEGCLNTCWKWQVYGRT